MIASPPIASDGRFKFTLEMFEALSDAGFFADQHVELLNGELFVKGRQNPEHSYAIQRLSIKLILALNPEAVVRTQLPLVLLSPPPDFVEPDMTVVKPPEQQYGQRNATNNDVIWVIEVSDSTLERDRKEKLEAYARNAIAEYWILNVAENELEVYREPDSKNYLSKRTLKAGQVVNPLGFPAISLEWWA